MTEKRSSVTFTDIINNHSLDYSLSTIFERAIPFLYDGFKDSNRFFLYSILNTKNPHELSKLVSYSGVVNDYGYEHGDQSIGDAGAKMVAPWNKNIQYLDGQGNFGTRLVKSSAQFRYIFCKLSDNFDLLFKDNDLLYDNSDEEIKIPKFYFPVIPMVLANGSSGIAVGYACNIIPHDPVWIRKAMNEYIKHGKITSNPVVKYPEFSGEVVQDPSDPLKYYQIGKVERLSDYRWKITEIPTVYEHAKYLQVLDKLQNNSAITSYIDGCGGTSDDLDKIEFVVRTAEKIDSYDDIIDLLELSKSERMNINLIIDNEGKYELKHYDDVRDVIKDFIDKRMKEFLPRRIKNNVDKFNGLVLYSTEMMRFIKLLIDDEYKLKGKPSKTIKKELSELGFNSEYIQKLLSTRIDHQTKEEIDKLNNKIKEYKKELNYWTNTDPTKEFLSDLKSLDPIFK